MTTSPPNDGRHILVISDATGSTAERVVRAVLHQFDTPITRLRIWPRVRTVDDVNLAMGQAQLTHSLVVHTLVNQQLRHYVGAVARHLGIEAVDLLGPMLDAMTAFLHAPPREQPGISVQLDEDYFKRVEAVEFSVKADDGRNPDGLDRADIVLVGVSRTSKTPVSAYLANQGYKVANVPLVHGIDPPAMLERLAPGHVFALTIDPEKLIDIRRRRLAWLGRDAEDDGYADRDYVFTEIRWALDLFRRRGWPILDVTRTAVEETAAEILRLRARIEAGRAPP